MKFEELREIVRNAGIVGCGGAGFPAYAKLDKRADTIILNCAECEPLFKVHRQVLEKYAYEICTALDMVTKAVEAKQFIVAVKGEYKATIEAVNAVLPQFEKGKISLLPEIYPAGDEVITIYETTGRVVPAGNIPISVGVIVFNVETVYNIYKAVNDGVPVTHKFVTVAGEVKKPQTYYVPVGTTFDELIRLSGGITKDDVKIINGGPMMGYVTTKYDVVNKNTNGILILPEDNPVITKKEAKAGISVLRTKSSCCQCRMCTDLCPRNLLGQPIRPNEFMKAVLTGKSDNVPVLMDSMYCVSCGICEMYACTQGLNPRMLIAEFKNNMRKKGVKITPLDNSGKVKQQREYRKVPIKRLKERLGLTVYDIEAPIVNAEVKPKRIKIMLSQHIGVPSVLAVKKNQKVAACDVIGSCHEDALCVPVHSPVRGKISETNDRFVMIDVD
ncbi:MAG: SLBB domain-containing protein [Clostridia bacterium]|nr:SLBB domain-containing protein [Clostridia bacterium]